MTGCTSNIVIERDAAVTVPQETNVCSETGCTTAETDRGNLKQDKENADKRLDVFMKRLEVSDVHLEVMSLTSKIDSDVAASKLPVGSSAIIIFGSLIKARAMAIL